MKISAYFQVNGIKISEPTMTDKPKMNFISMVNPELSQAIKRYQDFWIEENERIGIPKNLEGR